MTEWRTVPGWDAYEVSRCGRLRRVKVGANGCKPHEVFGSIYSTGYRCVSLYQDGRRWYGVGFHVLVALAFIGPKPSADHEVAHNDGIQLHNDAGNLRRDTGAGNAADRWRHGTQLFGETSPAAKLTDEKVITAFEMAKAGGKQRDIARSLGVKQGSLQRVLHRKNWKHIDIPPGLEYDPVRRSCKHGHPFAGDNLLIGKDGRRVCRACNRIRLERFKARRAQGASLC